MKDETDGIWRRDEIDSPCVKICAIHPASGLCVGCLRTLDEISRWSAMGHDARAAVIADLPARRSLTAQRRGGRAGRLAG